MRAFVAAEVTEQSLVDNIVGAQGAIGGRGVKPENLHFTLRFLGDIDGERALAVAERLKAVEFGPFDVTLRGVGTFGRPPRVVWAGVSDDAPLQGLAAGINRALGEGADKPFAAHLTIARLRRGEGADIERYRDYTWGVQRIDRFKLKESVLGRAGPSYTDIAEVACV